MSISVVIAGVTYQVPEVNEESWGTQVTNILVSLANQTLTRDKVTFVLSGGNLSFGTVFGISVKDLSSNSGNAADTGYLRLSNSDLISWRRDDNGSNVSLGLNGNSIQYNSIDLVDISAIQSLTNKTYSGTIGALSGGTVSSSTLDSVVIDADNNAISNIKVENFKAGVVDTDISGTESNLNIPSALAAKTYSDDVIVQEVIDRDDAIVSERDEVATLTNKTLTSPNINGGTITDATLAGTTTIINSDELQVTDPHIETNVGGTDVSSEGSGLIINREGTNGEISYADASPSKFKCGPIGSLVNIVDESSSQSLSNKDLTLSTSTGLDITSGEVKDHLIVDSVSADPTTPVNTDEVLIYNKDGKLTQLGTNGVPSSLGSGGGGGALNLWTEGNAEELVAGNFTTSGAGTFVISDLSADLINPSRSFKISSASSGFKVISPDIEVPLGYRNRLLGVLFPYRSNDGALIKVNITDESGTLISSSPNLIASQSSSIGSAAFSYGFNVGDNDLVKIEIEATGTVGEFIWDDVVLTPDPLTTLPDTTFTLSGGANTVTLSKFNNSNDSPATNAGIGTFTSSATLTEGTDYEDYGAEWIESITTASTVVNFFAAFDSTTQMTYTITSVDNAFDTSRLPTVAFSQTSVVDALPYGADNLDTLVRNPYHVVSASFSGNKLVIVIQGTSIKESGGTATTATSGSANFGLSVTKTAGFGPATLVPSTTQKVVTYNESIDTENRFSARIDNTEDVGAAAVISENVSFIKSATKTGTGQITVVFNDNMFSVTPSVQCVAVPPDGTEGDINSDNTQITEITTTGFKIGYLHQGGGMGGEAHVFRNQGDIDISVSRQGADYKEPLPTGTFIIAPDPNPLGTVIDSILTETQFNDQSSGGWVLCDGRDITGSALAGITGVTTSPDMLGRFRAMAGGTSSKVLNTQLASEVKAADVALTDPGHTHPGTQGVNGGVSGSLNGYQAVTSRSAGGTYDTGSSTTGITISAGSETRPETYVINSFIRID